MGQTVEQDFLPPPEPPLRRWLLLAALIHVPLLVALTLGVDWKRQSERVTGKPPTTSPAPDAQVLGARAAASSSAPSQAACPIRPLLAAAGTSDAELFPPADMAGKTMADIGAFLVAGKEAAAAGQQRNAEVAYLTSCRVANALQGPASVASADARYQLGRLYAIVAQNGKTPPLAPRAELLKRAEALFTDSMQIYRAQLGQAHEKTRFATEGLANVQQLSNAADRQRSS